jgi:putative spermidine/putrescine transport system permease protein/mannopine transport system permease protein
MSLGGSKAETLPQARAARDERRRIWSPGTSYYILAAVPALFLGVFFLFPLLRVVARGFSGADGLQQYRVIWGNASYLTALTTTLQTALTVTFFCLLLAYPLALVGARLQGRAYTLFMALLLVPLWTSVVIRSYAWMVMFQRSGPVNQLLVWLEWIDAPIRLLQTAFAVNIGMVHILLPFMVLPILNTMRGLDPTFLQAGRILGAAPLRLFFRIYLPLTLPGVSAGVILVFISALGFFITPALLGGGRNTMIAVLIEQQAVDWLNWPLASALATILLVVSVAIYGGYSHLTRRVVEARS